LSLLGAAELEEREPNRVVCVAILQLGTLGDDVVREFRERR